jgi:ribonuclease VapC
MVIDTSAVLAVLFSEPDRGHLLSRIAADRVRMMSAVSLVEGTQVIDLRWRTAGVYEFDRFLARTGIDVIPLDREQAEVARVALRRFGKGRSPARLNFGDCFAYALAKTTGEPLLYKGTDFGATDMATV